MRVVFLLSLIAMATAGMAPIFRSAERIPGRYIVKLRDGTDIDSVIRTSSLRNVRPSRRFNKVFTGFAAELTDNMVEILRGLDAVEYIEEDGVVRALQVESWGLDRVDQLDSQLDDNYKPFGTGTGVHIYIIDTGINTHHVDYQGRGATNVWDYSGTITEDCNGHGTHCAGTAAGTTYGVAKEANVYGVRVLDCGGSGSWSAVIGGCEYVANYANFPAVASMSLGGGESQSVNDAVQGMIDAGIPVAVAAGNEDTDACTKSPASTPDAITVGATDSSDVRAYFSNYGSCVDIFAPGVSITSSWIPGTSDTNTISGTSMATPHVAGAVALLRESNHTLTPAEITEALQLKAIGNCVSDTMDSPNLLLYVGEGSGGGFIPTPPPPCITTMTDPTGSFSNINYGNNEHCEYYINVDSGNVAVLNFNTFDIEDHSSCSYDSVTVYDGDSTSADKFGKFCGNSPPAEIISTTNNLLVVFDTDGSVTKPGFEAEYYSCTDCESTVPVDACGSTFTEPTTITSPNYPSNYDNGINDCKTTIQALDGQIINLSFEDFNVESQSSCGYDSLKIYDGPSESSTLLATLCGTTLPSDVTSTGNQMYLVFTTDSSVTRKGYKASFTFQ